jgi:hypothetical protein
MTDRSAFLLEYSRRVKHAFFIRSYFAEFDAATTAAEIDDVLSTIDHDLENELSFLRYQ